MFPCLIKCYTENYRHIHDEIHVKSVSKVFTLQNEPKFISVCLVELDLDVLISLPLDKMLVNKQKPKMTSFSGFSYMFE